MWQFYFFKKNRILSIWRWINTKVFIGSSKPSACTKLFSEIRRVNFIADKVWNNIYFFDIRRGSWIQIRKTLSDATLTLLGRTTYLAIMLLLVKYRFQIYWSDGKHMLKYGQKINVNRQQLKINVYVKCFAIIVVQENIWILFVTFTFLCTDLYFLCEYFFYTSLSLILLPSSGF